ncbi:hypothetical protein [Coraliomargarita sinensis]|uniref:hypothetical protein n=1 Tax=Coraliomargarita sinensis TaxID=2174842 RepID=UPI0011B6F20F|nr:hypothetical protein [Coraliomargarita sinensis]
MHATEFNRKINELAKRGERLAEELEAGQADSPFTNEFKSLQQSVKSTPIRALVIGIDTETTYAALSSLIEQEYNVCKVFVPSRLGYSEVVLQERGFQMDTGEQRLEFDDVDSFVTALQDAHVLHDEDNPKWMDPLRLQLKAPAHLSGLSLLVPDSIDSIVKKPALLSTLADQADWLFLAGYTGSSFTDEQISALQIMLNSMIGFQGLLVSPKESTNSKQVQSAWWKNWRVNLSLGVVNIESSILSGRLAMLTNPESELRQFILESRRAHRLESGFDLLLNELQQQLKRLNSKARLVKGELDSGSGERGTLRRSAEDLRSRISDEYDSIRQSLEQEAKRQLSPQGEIYLALRNEVDRFEADDIEQTMAGSKIKLRINDETRADYTQLITRLGKQRIQADIQLLGEGIGLSVQSVEKDLEEMTGFRTKLSLDPIDERQIWDSTEAIARPEIKYRGDMDKPTLMKRFQSARQGIMGLMMMGMVFTGISAISGGSSGGGGTSFRSYLYAAMLPLLVLGFFYTYISFRKKEAETLDREVERFHEGLFSELRRIMSDVLRQEQNLLGQHYQKQSKKAQKQIAEALERADNLQNQQLNEIKRKSADQQRQIDQRSLVLKDSIRQSEKLSNEKRSLDRLKAEWLGDWIERFNRGEFKPPKA